MELNLTLSQGQCYAILALEKMQKGGEIRRASLGDFQRELDLQMAELFRTDYITPKMAEVLVREKQILSGFSPLKIYRYHCLIHGTIERDVYIMAPNRTAANRELQRYLPDEQINEVTEMTRTEYLEFLNISGTGAEQTISELFSKPGILPTL
ncbi:hypothetical protein A8L34_28090 [Bacillus sp. FJAT-27264]|uniref:hypothetical protein n=1 Tax=Paenibacillus sp. (strain DSM 101736 / FJAT-27264) TaxID=1850362 RepID=UPI000807C516|nr:hypothetical protein [Bacillus sp. FJAT-27264]OBZ15910.1 hypothetical protein A8L34_28090 [Bacillus sp. FJAT-27264]